MVENTRATVLGSYLPSCQFWLALTACRLSYAEDRVEIAQDIHALLAVVDFNATNNKLAC